MQCRNVTTSHPFADGGRLLPRTTIALSPFIRLSAVYLGYLGVTVQEKLRSGWPGPFVKVEGCCDKSFVCFRCVQTSQVQL
jgi:hypothetical protein